MKSWVRKSIKVGVLAAGFLLATGTNAQATDVISVDNDGALNGTQVVVPVQAPINVCGVGVGVAGSGTGVADCDATAISGHHGKDWQSERGVTKYQPRHAAPERAQESGDTVVSAGNSGLLNGTQVFAPIQIPVNVCGVGVGILGHGSGAAKCDATAKRESGGDITAISADNQGLLNGTQLIMPIQAPINVCGIGVGILGSGQGYADCDATAISGKEKKKGGYESGRAPEVLPLGGLTGALPLGGLTGGLPLAGAADSPAASDDAGAAFTGDALAPTGGEAMAKPAKAANEPANADKPANGGARDGGGDTVVSAGNSGLLNGTQVFAPIQIPVNVCGVGVGILGSGTGIAKCDATAKR